MKQRWLVLLLLPGACRAASLTGEVLCVNGQAAVGAEVRLDREVRPFSFETLRTALTDAAGRFSLEAPAGWHDVTVFGCQVDTQAAVELVEGAEATVRLGVDWPWSRAPWATVQVRAATPDGRPAAGQPLHLTAWGRLDVLPGAERVAGQRVHHSRALAGADGQATLRVPPGLTAYEVRAATGSVLDARLARPNEALPAVAITVPAGQPDEAERAAPVAVTKAGRRVSGVVRDLQGRPVHGCLVAGHRSTSWLVRDDCWALARGGGQPVTAPVWTGPDGAYTLELPAAGAWHLLYRAPGYLPEVSRCQPGEAPLDVVLASNRSELRGTIVGPEGEPWAGRAAVIEVSGASVEQPSGQPPSGRWVVLTDSAGRYRLSARDLPLGRCRLRAAAGHLDSQEARAMLVSVQAATCDLRLREPASAHGRVFVADGSPAVGALVQRVDCARPVTAWTDEQGRFSMPSENDEWVWVAVLAPGCAARVLRLETAAAKEIRLRPGHSLAGSCRPRQAMPAVRGVSGWAAELLGGWLSLPPSAETGRFAWVGLPPGQVWLEARAADCDSQVRQVTLPADGPLEVRLGPTRYGALEGTIVDADGRPRPGLAVWWNDSAPPLTRGETTTDRRGRFRMDRLPAGTYRVEMPHPTSAERQPEPLTVAADTLTKVVLQPERRVFGRVSGVPTGWVGALALAPRGAPVVGDEAMPAALWFDAVGVRSRLAATRSLQVRIEHRHPNPLAGDWEPGAEGYRTLAAPGWNETFLLLSTETEPYVTDGVSLPLGRRYVDLGGGRFDVAVPAGGATLRVAVAGLGDHRPQAEARVLVRSEQGGRAAASAAVDGPREAVLPCLPAGEYLVVLDLPGLAGPRLRVSLSAGRETRLDLAPCRGVTVSGHRRGGSEGDWVVLRNATTYAATRVGPERFSLAGVPPGRYQLWHGNAVSSLTSELVVGETPVELDLLPPEL